MLKTVCKCLFGVCCVQSWRWTHLHHPTAASGPSRLQSLHLAAQHGRQGTKHTHVLWFMILLVLSQRLNAFKIKLCLHNMCVYIKMHTHTCIYLKNCMCIYLDLYTVAHRSEYTPHIFVNLSCDKTEEITLCYNVKWWVYSLYKSVNLLKITQHTAINV